MTSTTIVQAPRRAVVERLSSGVLQPLRNALTPYTFTVALEVWDDDAASRLPEAHESASEPVQIVTENADLIIVPD